jgi:hypothetical protein
MQAVYSVSVSVGLVGAAKRSKENGSNSTGTNRGATTTTDV